MPQTAVRGCQCTSKCVPLMYLAPSSLPFCVLTGDSHWHNAIICVCVRNAWLTTVTLHYTVNALSAGKVGSVFHFKCSLLPSSLFVLRRQLLLNSVYWHLSAVYLEFCFSSLLSTLVFVSYQNGFCRGFPASPLRLRREICLSRYQYCALVLNLHSLAVQVFKGRNYVWCRGITHIQFDFEYPP